LGGKIRLFISGGAPLDQDVKYFMIVTFGCPVLEAYGAAESAGGISSTGSWETRAGRIIYLPCLKMKLVDLPELGYLTTDNPPRDRLTRNPDQTAKVFDKDGWLISEILVQIYHGLYVAPQLIQSTDSLKLSHKSSLQ
jgi:long-subunit acyl-CoA synthetase (AMP-forming)